MPTMYGKRHTFPRPMATPTIVMNAPKREPNVSRALMEPRFYLFAVPQSALRLRSTTAGTGLLRLLGEACPHLYRLVPSDRTLTQIGPFRVDRTAYLTRPCAQSRSSGAAHAIHTSHF